MYGMAAISILADFGPIASLDEREVDSVALESAAKNLWTKPIGCKAAEYLERALLLVLAIAGSPNPTSADWFASPFEFTDAH